MRMFLPLPPPMQKILFIVFTLLVLQLVVVHAQVNYVSTGCVSDYSNYTQGSVYQKNLNLLFSNLSSQASDVKFYNNTFGDIPNKVYGLFQCRQDLSLEVCNACIQDATQRIVQDCPSYKEAVVWYHECMLRYANRTIFSTLETHPSADRWSRTNVSNYDQFAPLLAKTINGLMKEAASGTPSVHFATREANATLFGELYSLAQCTPDLDGLQCYNCLRSAKTEMARCCNASIHARIFLPSCQLWYDTTSRFYNVIDLPSPASSPTISNKPDDKLKPHARPSIIAGIAVAALVGIVLFFYVIWLCLHRKSTGIVSNKLPPQVSKASADVEINEIRTLGSMEFDLNIITEATCDFSMDNKLGEGGFGEVYKGKLEDGQEVAIKRLSKNSGQGIEEFKTEVLLVAKLQHKNLVKLLGFCLEKTEKILVYEFLQNSSLDRYLFDLTKKVSLDWKIRYELIVGIARGLLYLHEDSRLKIIHRDLKPSNILLDEGMNPKISDFGLAKLFGVDQTQGDTKRIAGTYGYMAPEYAMAGHFSVKSDVYSFGIIVLEIVSGKRNRFLGRPQVEEALLHHAWRLWNENKALQLVDRALAKKYPREEVSKCIHIALLCIQENAAERPGMTTVVSALNRQYISLPMPKSPNFFGNVTTSEIEIEYHQEMDQQGYLHVYSGTQTITDSSILYPR